MNIAIIGSGISGLGAAYLLHSKHQITLYEKNSYLGGHSRTLDVTMGDTITPVDTGFIVFNYRNYPLLTGLFNHLNIPVEQSDMSFAASIDDGWLEYGTQRAWNLFAQKRNVLRPQFLGMIRDILKFNKHALEYMNKDSQVTLGQCLDELGMGAWFREYFLLAMGGAIWSCPLSQMLEFPASTFVRFFHNHGLLTVNDQPQWYTVTGGSREYVRRLSTQFADRVKLDCGAVSVRRENGEVVVEDTQGKRASYDHVIFACHADQAMQMLADPSEDEQRIIAAFRYQSNRVVLHSDESFMPKNRGCWASWVYLLEGRADEKPAISLSYWMNRLQNLETEKPLIVTLNPGREPQGNLLHNAHEFEHPIFDAAAIDAQSKLHEVQGQQNTWYCGAYQRYGFHEDGLWSAVNVARELGANLPWE